MPVRHFIFIAAVAIASFSNANRLDNVSGQLAANGIIPSSSDSSSSSTGQSTGQTSLTSSSSSPDITTNPISSTSTPVGNVTVPSTDSSTSTSVNVTVPIVVSSTSSSAAAGNTTTTTSSSPMLQANGQVLVWSVDHLGTDGAAEMPSTIVNGTVNDTVQVPAANSNTANSPFVRLFSISSSNNGSTTTNSSSTSTSSIVGQLNPIYLMTQKLPDPSLLNQPNWPVSKRFNTFLIQSQPVSSVSTTVSAFSLTPRNQRSVRIPSNRVMTGRTATSFNFSSPTLDISSSSVVGAISGN